MVIDYQEYQTRDTYPMTYGPPLRLQINISQKFGELEGVKMPIKIKQSFNNKVEIYRFYGKKHNQHIGNFSHQDNKWTSLQYSQKMLLEGWVLAKSFSHNEIFVSPSGNNAYVFFDVFGERPGYYKDVWYLDNSPGHSIIGPFAQDFFLENRSFEIGENPGEINFQRNSGEESEIFNNLNSLISRSDLFYEPENSKAHIPVFEFLSISGEKFYFQEPPTEKIPTMVIADGVFLRPDDPIDGTGKQYDYCLNENELVVHNIKNGSFFGWSNFLYIIYSCKVSDGYNKKIGKISKEVFKAESIKTEFELKYEWNNVFAIVAVDGVTISPSSIAGEYFTIQKNENERMKSLVLTNPPRHNVVVYYSYGDRNTEPQNIIKDVFTIRDENNLRYYLSRVPNDEFPPMVFDGGLYLMAGENYDYTIKQEGSSCVLELRRMAEGGGPLQVIYSHA